MTTTRKQYSLKFKARVATEAIRGFKAHPMQIAKWRKAALFAGALLAWPLGAQTPAARGYVDPSTCAECHARIAENYARTGMGRSFGSVRADASLPEFDAASFSHIESAERFTPVRRAGNYYVRRESPGGLNALEVSVDYVMRSGDHARSYLH